MLPMMRARSAILEMQPATQLARLASPLPSERAAAGEVAQQAARNVSLPTGEMKGEPL